MLRLGAYGECDAVIRFVSSAGDRIACLSQLGKEMRREHFTTGSLRAFPN